MNETMVNAATEAAVNNETAAVAADVIAQTAAKGGSLESVVGVLLIGGAFIAAEKVIEVGVKYVKKAWNKAKEAKLQAAENAAQVAEESKEEETSEE